VTRLGGDLPGAVARRVPWPAWWWAAPPGTAVS